MDVGSFFVLLLILIVIPVVILWTTIVQVEQYQSGVALRLGTFSGMLTPGWNFVVPLITQVYRVDLRDQILQVPCQEIITKDNSRTMVDAVVHYKIVDAKKAILSVVNPKVAMVDFSMSSLRSSVEGMDFHEIFSGLNVKMSSVEVILRDKLSIMTESIGIEINNVQIMEIGHSSSVSVDAAVEEQIIAEREEHEAIFNIGWKRSLWNFVTQRSLRSFFGTSNHSSEIRKASSIAYKLFTLIFLIVSLLWLYMLIWGFSLLPGALSVTAELRDEVTLAEILMVNYIFLYAPVILLFHWPHTYWTRRVAETRLVTKEKEARVRETEIREKDTVGTTLRDLYVLRAEALGAQQQGMDVSDLIEAIDALDNKFLEEAKQDLSIEEIAKLQEEFVGSLDKENAA